MVQGNIIHLDYKKKTKNIFLTLVRMVECKEGLCWC